jgi:hypothetical protein
VPSKFAGPSEITALTPAETPTPLSLEEHRELAAEIKLASARFIELQKLMAKVYGPHRLAATNFCKAVEALELVQSDMEVQAAHDLPGLTVDGLYR